jgi:TetR/AcrR family transcriptional regulator, transcriptional repressor for nem operon
VARTKEFDPDAALDVAMRLFWERGYEATSMADLLSAMGIGRASFYDTFGSKGDLYSRALERYMAGAPGPTPVEILARPGRALDAVADLVEDYATPNKAGDPRGCLVVNACVECPDGPGPVRSRLDTYRAGQEAALTATLYRARAEGDLAADADPVALARFLCVMFNGMQVLARSGEAAAPQLRSAADVALQALALR